MIFVFMLIGSLILNQALLTPLHRKTNVQKSVRNVDDVQVMNLSTTTKFNVHGHELELELAQGQPQLSAIQVDDFDDDDDDDDFGVDQEDEFFKNDKQLDEPNENNPQPHTVHSGVVLIKTTQLDPHKTNETHSANQTQVVVDDNHHLNQNNTHTLNNTYGAHENDEESYHRGNLTPDMHDQMEDNHSGEHDTTGDSGGHEHVTHGHEYAVEEENHPGHGGGGHDKGHEGHNVPPPSHQLQLHMYSYKPEGFIMYSRHVDMKTILVGFVYHVVNHYDRYIIRLRYHGHEEYSTNKLRINKTGNNEIVMKKFPQAEYIVCVTLFSSFGLPEYPPISTSDMCIDVNIGEPYPIGGHHSSTGLLSPLLLACAAILLLIIIAGNYIKDAFMARRKRAEEIKKIKELRQRRLSGIKASFEALDKEAAHERFDNYLKTPEEPKWQAAAKMTQIVDNSSSVDLTKPRYYYENNGLVNDYDYESDSGIRFLDQRPSQVNLSSLDTLGHLLNDKPWLSRSRQA